jgi:exopolysaccharide production protein ExoZ
MLHSRRGSGGHAHDPGDFSGPAAWPAMTESKPPFFQGVHALRAVAAMLVLYSHADYMTSEFAGIPFSADRIAALLGRLGVILFFAISGFVIALNRSRPPGQFALHRVLRIYPSYWLAMIIAAVALESVGRHASTIPSMVLLFPSTSGSDALTIPYWTLIFEVTFYALATVAFAFRLSDRTLTVVAVVWIAAVNLFGVNPENPVQYSLPGSAILLSSPVQVFPMGLICGINFDKLRRAGRYVYLALAVLCLAISSQFADFSILKTMLYGIAASCSVLAFADISARAFVVTLFGNASYGIYLIHFPALMFVALLAPSLVHLGIAYFYAVGLTAGLAFGSIDHRLYGWMTSKVRGTHWLRGVS